MLSFDMLSLDMLSFLSIMPPVLDILPSDIASVFLSILLSILESFAMPCLLMASSANAAGAKARPAATVEATIKRLIMIILLGMQFATLSRYQAIRTRAPQVSVADCGEKLTVS